jgi:tRNA A-37 threonylcarbamoyl transferase component Bud32
VCYEIFFSDDPPHRQFAMTETAADSPTFNHPNYTLLDDERIVRKSSAPPLTMSDELEVLTEIARYVQARMINSGFERIIIPDDEAPISTFILATSDWLSNPRLLIIIQNSVGSMMGIFSRSLCLEQGLSKGSMLPYIDRAKRNGYAVMVLRPNTNSVVQDESVKPPLKIPIDGSESPETHALFVWNNIIAKADHIEQIALLSYGNGASLCKDILLRQMVRSKEDESELNRIVGFCAIEASLIAEDDDAADFKKFLKGIAINMEQSNSPKGYRLNYRRDKLGCTTLSLGLPPGASPDSIQNVATSIPLALESAFKYLEMAFGSVRNLAVSYGAAAATEEGHTPDTAEVAVAPPDINDFELGPSSPQPTADETAAPKVGIFSRLLGRKPAANASGTDASSSSSPSARGVAKRASASDMNIGSELEESLSVSDFDLLKVVGKGAFGKVMLVRKRANKGAGQIYAMKVLKKSVISAKGQVEHTKSERSILCEIRHPFIVRLRFAFQSDDKLYLVTDYYNGGSLFYHLRKSRAFTEERAKFYAAELLSALDHLHQQHIIYRDLKLENVLMDNIGHIALTDFGLSKQNIDLTGGASTFCGTAEYIAPELLKGQKYGTAVDWWSFGILLFEMMHGRTPFYDKNRKVFPSSLSVSTLSVPLSVSVSLSFSLSLSLSLSLCLSLSLSLSLTLTLLDLHLLPTVVDVLPYY